MILILSAAPRIYEAEFGVTGFLFALLFAAHGLGIIIGQIANALVFLGLIGTEAVVVDADCLLVVAFTVVADGIARVVEASRVGSPRCARW